LKKRMQNIMMIRMVNIPPVAVRYSVDPLYLRSCVAGKKSNLTNNWRKDFIQLIASPNNNY
jgi:hypothetical protein